MLCLPLPSCCLYTAKECGASVVPEMLGPVNVEISTECGEFALFPFGAKLRTLTVGGFCLLVAFARCHMSCFYIGKIY